MPARLRLADPQAVAAAVDRFRAGSHDAVDARLLTKHLLAVLVAKAPGGAVEVRVPPYAVAQCVAGTRHTRGTPPAVVETDPETWIALALGDLDWKQAQDAGRLRASGERSDLTPLLPLA
ncbi:MAG TPA: sterol carrier family protein [Nocardioides sp.]|nr:sterol carrier family protein [Nocardioides sp.]